ncbi:hypothetical protein BK126_04675 [Paenibacillus sp. FSL H7-0326]|uniref:helix-turn-helix domain-containing protein n=1 Tax=Paenibacillus sp. FSL H7-0326 TaxID=1921144 RepID=UPI00096D9BAE|nr:helix-turn-helix transcriptional regulator [Paenibacillus sp. FSL H7-0326]OMC71394.1 hypothetical protein BK126_04675 [Paenibacillus sp. FSL H7-0326]
MSGTGYRIKSFRKEQKWTQQELARRLNVSTQVISNWERDYSVPVHSDLTKLALLFHTTTDFLLGRTDDIFNDQLDMSDRIDILNSNNISEDIFQFPPKEQLSFDLIKLLRSSYSITFKDYLLNHNERTIIIKQIDLFMSSMRDAIDNVIYQAETATDTKLMWRGDTLEKY